MVAFPRDLNMARYAYACSGIWLFLVGRASPWNDENEVSEINDKQQWQ